MKTLLVSHCSISRNSTMKGQTAFCPKTGAELSKERYYADSNIPFRIPERESVDEAFWDEDAEGLLTLGEAKSANTAILSYFERCHQKVREHDEELYRRAWSAIRQLKLKTSAWDVWIWYALAERLDRLGFDTSWMLQYAEPRCPRCSSRLRYEEPPTGYANMICGSSCGNETSSDRTVEIYDRIKDVYNATFTDDPVERLHIF